MASVPYTGDGPQLAPDSRAPDDYERLDVNPNQFGAGVGSGLEQLGAGVQKAQQFYGQVAADNATNDFQDFATKKLYGDPAKQVPQPDGTMGPDTGYMGLRGRAALDARPQLETDFSDRLAQTRSTLNSPEQQQQFDNFTRRYRANVSQTIGSHADNQFGAWAGETNKATGDLSLQHIATSPLDGPSVAHATQDLISSRVKDAQMRGGGDALIQEAQSSARRDALRAQVEAVGATDPSKALDLLNTNRSAAGMFYEPLQKQFRVQADQQAGKDLFTSVMAPSTGTATGTKAADGSAAVPLPPERGDGGPPTSPGAGDTVPTPRDTSDQPVSPAAVRTLPARPFTDPTDRSHSNPQPTPGGAALPYFTQAGAPYGISGNYLTRTKMIESGSGSGNVTSSTGAQGPFQFIPSTWAHYGNGGNPNDFGAATAAAVRLAADNKAALTRSLGRAPSDAELYLAHQQGSGGAARLLANPNARAGDLVGDRAISANGGNPNAPASDFTAKWEAKFNGTKGPTGPLPMFAAPGGFAPGGYAAPQDPALPPILPSVLAPQGAAGAPAAAPPAPEAPPPSLMEQARAEPQVPAPAPTEEPLTRDPKADAYAKIEASGSSPEVKAHAFAAANQYFSQQQIASEEDQRSKKARSEQAYGHYTQRALQGDLSPQMLQQVAADPNLLPETKWALSRAIREESQRDGGGGDKEAKSYGPGFFDALKGITAPQGDASRIIDDTEVLRRAGPGGDLTFAGAEKIISTKHASERNVNDAAVNRTKTGLLDYAKGQLSFDQETVAPGFPGLKDPKGAALFNSEFLPKFEAGYDDWLKDGKKPFDYLNRDNVDKMLKGMRPKSQMEADRLAALTGGGDPPAAPDAAAGGAGGAAPPQPPAAPAAPAAPPEPTPPSPPNTNPDEWARVVQAVPRAANGRPWPVTNWAGAVAALKADPSAVNRSRFDKRFGSAGYRAEDVLKRLMPQNPMGDEPMGGL